MKTAKSLLLTSAGLTLAAAGAYASYAFKAYYRLPDHLRLAFVPKALPQVVPGQTYTLQSWNIGYGSYPPSYSFFMSGGAYSRAYSRQAVQAAMRGIVAETKQGQADFNLFQEVDVDGDRSQHVDELASLTEAFPHSVCVYGQNYDSPYLAYPFTRPIGKAKSGLVTLSQFQAASAFRYQLPVSTSAAKFLDLDRAFTAVQLPVTNGRLLELINVHLSAFTKDRRLQQAQFAKLFTYLAQAYAKGHYVIAAGDFNHRLLKNTAEIYETDAKSRTWTHYFPVHELPQGFYVPVKGLAEAKVPSVRALDRPFEPGHSFVSLIDGFILSANVTAEQVQVVDAGFADSDHNPVRLQLHLQDRG